MKSTQKSTLFILIICLSYFGFSCQQTQPKSFTCVGFKDTVLHKFVYKTTDVPPEPVGGFESINKLISKNFKPDGESFGRIVVAFVVETNGTIDGKRTLHDPFGKNGSASKQLLNILTKVTWQPGVCNGRKVPCLQVFPLNIDLGE